MTDAYDRAVARVTELCDGFRLTPVDSPRALFAQLGVPPSSGYRQTAMLERRGVLQPDTDGRLSLGPAALDIGLSAWGLGRFAAIVPPVLSELRRSARLTACFAVHAGRRLHLGPVSLGRGHSYVLPVESGTYTISRTDTGRAVHRYVLLAGESAPTFGFFAPVGRGSNEARALLGVLARRSAFSDAGAVAARVARAGAQIAETTDPDL